MLSNFDHVLSFLVWNRKLILPPHFANRVNPIIHRNLDLFKLCEVFLEQILCFLGSVAWCASLLVHWIEWRHSELRILRRSFGLLRPTTRKVVAAFSHLTDHSKVINLVRLLLILVFSCTELSWKSVGRGHIIENIIGRLRDHISCKNIFYFVPKKCDDAFFVLSFWRTILTDVCLPDCFFSFHKHRRTTMMIPELLNFVATALIISQPGNLLLILIH